MSTSPPVGPWLLTPLPGRVVHPLEDGWQMCLAPAAAGWSPEEADARGEWLETTVPTTAAATLAAHGRDLTGRDLDAEEAWFRLTLPAGDAARARLALAGLATHADVFLDGEPVLRSESMFESHVLELPPRRARASTLHVRCAALAPVLQKRRPRPRWPSKLVSQRNLRFVRTSLLGRMPGLPVPVPLGPYRPVHLVEESALSLDALRVSPRVHGAAGEVVLQATLRTLDGSPVEHATLHVGASEQRLRVTPRDVGVAIDGTLTLPHVERWWPHTHGAQPRYPASLHVQHGRGERSEIPLSPVAFRSVAVDATPPGFGFVINDVPVHARGACWMPLDAQRLSSDEAGYRAALLQARDAGMNMLRLPGFTLYEDPLFHDLCDALGLLVWQDLMFANFDYPEGDPAFVAAAEAETRAVLDALADRPSTALICGNSEAEQQAAMMGLPSAQRGQPLFEQTLRAQVEARGVAYQPSTPHGGALPFKTRSGTTHYYGVGAYERPLEDVHAARVRFTPECLAFSHVPEDDALAALGSAEPFHSPVYRAGVPRDPGASWDFGDTTEHYVERLFGVDARSLRRGDPQRHLELSRRAPGQAIAATLGAWRRPDDPCQGALLFTYRDLRPGAGWGITAHDGSAKAAYWLARRAWAPRAMWFVDEGLNGVRLWLANDRPAPWAATLTLCALRSDGHAIVRAEREVVVPAHGGWGEDVEDLFERFLDAAGAYRFGPGEHDLLWARFGDGQDAVEASFFPGGGAPARIDVGLRARAFPLEDGTYRVEVETARVARSVRVEAAHFEPSDSYFDVVPGAPRTLHLHPRRGATPTRLRARLSALNALHSAPVETTSPESP